MRVTAEQYDRRKENRITGEYEIRPPNTFRRGRQPIESRCENCGRPTEYLFDGVKFPGMSQEKIRKMPTDHLRRKAAFSRPFLTEAAKVCARCRPPSNLEIEEILASGSLQK